MSVGQTGSFVLDMSPRLLFGAMVVNFTVSGPPSQELLRGACLSGLHRAIGLRTIWSNVVPAPRDHQPPSVQRCEKKKKKKKKNP